MYVLRKRYKYSLCFGVTDTEHVWGVTNNNNTVNSRHSDQATFWARSFFAISIVTPSFLLSSYKKKVCFYKNNVH